MKTKLKLKLKMRRDDRRKAHNYCGISSDPIAAVSTLYYRRGDQLYGTGPKQNYPRVFKEEVFTWENS